ncbi:MAG: alpha/beta hydrolase, partial [Actinomycetia bacterium]|nr:alpha/beta hydrolase [Actinomycetes bacterium]
MNCATQSVPKPTIPRGRHPAGHPNPHKLKHADVDVTTSDGVQLAVRDYGPPSTRHTVVLLHGLCVSDEVWSLQVDYLLRRYGESIRVISYDHRGHGRSGRAPVDTYRIDQLASDLADVLIALNVNGPLTLVGHSMGGMTALAYLARPSADRPVDPQGLVLAATTAGKLAQRGLGRLLATPGAGALLTLVDRLPKQALNALVGLACSTLSRIWPTQRAMLVAIAHAAANKPIPTATGFLPTLSRYDQYRTLGGIRAKTVVISGGTDRLTPASHSCDLVGAIPGAAHVHLPHAGHMLPRGVPDVINHAIRR